MRTIRMFLIVAILLGICTSCDLLNPKPFPLYNTNWDITTETSYGHESLHFTQNAYAFKDETDAVIERGSISQEKYSSYVYTVEECTISGLEDIVGQSRFAAFTLTGDTLTIDFFLDSSKDTLLIALTAEKL
ncbi:hypothetical protein SDC9_172347 [bioreactor metagenome]|uniref:Uncharacterized protein n=1 Tax=bioreactor metagenome TaxID=1076179 RepID=A0A645GDE4_9ZZZZ|nr:hypothetical protein [Sphaerochaeta associata]MEA5027697.1 hypothetical protein [Sphaerochaeta associata]